MSNRAKVAQHSEEAEEAESRRSPSGRIVYKAILKEGEEELTRPPSALFWSALAAGLSMGFSLFAEGLLTTYLPDAPWRPLVSKFGYCFGFLVVVLGRQQLFTENTLTPILPLLQHLNRATTTRVLRLWAIVLFANLLGAVAIAFVAVHSTIFEDEVRKTFIHLGAGHVGHGFVTTLLRGVVAGWLLALMVWLMPFAESGRIWVIIFVTYLVGLGEFSHIVAGSVAAFAWAWAEAGRWGDVLIGFCLPTLIGNVLGGTILVAVLNHGQVVAGRTDATI